MNNSHSGMLPRSDILTRRHPYRRNASTAELRSDIASPAGMCRCSATAKKWA